MKFKALCVYLLIGMQVGCMSTTGKREIVEIGGQADKPKWVDSTKLAWNEGDEVFFRTQYTIKGDERVNGCYQLAKLEVKETLLREMAEEIRGQIDNAQQSISENAEIILNQSRSGEFSGRVTGLRHLEQYHERFKVGGSERIDCFVLSVIKKSEYEAIRKVIVFKMAEVDPGLKAAMNKRQIDFFSTKASNKVQE